MDRRSFLAAVSLFSSASTLFSPLAEASAGLSTPTRTIRRRRVEVECNGSRYEVVDFAVALDAGMDAFSRTKVYEVNVDFSIYGATLLPFARTPDAVKCAFICERYRMSMELTMYTCNVGHAEAGPLITSYECVANGDPIVEYV